MPQSGRFGRNCAQCSRTLALALLREMRFWCNAVLAPFASLANCTTCLPRHCRSRRGYPFRTSRKTVSVHDCQLRRHYPSLRPCTE
jgi:hypothetical protein